MAHNTIFFEKNNVLWQKKIRWQIHATIRTNIQILYFTFYIVIIIETVTQDMPQVAELFNKF